MMQIHTDMFTELFGEIDKLDKTMYYEHKLFFSRVWNFGRIFLLERGIRQGDPISSFIYLLLVLSILIYIFILWKNVLKSGIGIKVSKKSPITPYIIFADDCMIFFKASRKAVRTGKAILENYSNISSQLVNFYNKVQLSTRSEDWKKHDIVDICRYLHQTALEPILAARTLIIENQERFVKIKVRKYELT